ncbi:MAG: LysR family transcriptional regulator, partial [Gemmobacter sp.]
MVAKHIRVLEERLQVTLIRRTTRRQSLTDVGGPVDAGRRYLRAARHGNPDSRAHAGPGAALRLGQIGGDRRAVTGRRLLKVPRSEA